MHLIEAKSETYPVLRLRFVFYGSDYTVLAQAILEDI